MRWLDLDVTLDWRRWLVGVEWSRARVCIVLGPLAATWWRV